MKRGRRRPARAERVPRVPPILSKLMGNAIIPFIGNSGSSSSCAVLVSSSSDNFYFSSNDVQDFSNALIILLVINTDGVSSSHDAGFITKGSSSTMRCTYNGAIISINWSSNSGITGHLSQTLRNGTLRVVAILS